MTMKYCNIKLKFLLSRDTQKIGKQRKLTISYHDKLYLLTYVKPQCFGYFI